MSDTKHIFRDGLLEGRVALVTGGSSGIGKGIADMLHRLGAHVHIVGRDPQKLQATLKDLERDVGRLQVHAADVRDYAATQEVVRAVTAAQGRIDILVNNAAGNFHCPFEQLTPNGWKAVVDIDLNGTFNYCHAAFDALKASLWGGRVINITLAQGVSGWPGSAHAASAKAGVTALTRSLAVEWGRHGIRINNILPGPIGDTEGVRRLYEERGLAEKELARLCLDHFGTTGDIAQSVAFLCSEAGNFITGCDMTVDGGRWLKRAWV